jgi:hypothetical protein
MEATMDRRGLSKVLLGTAAGAALLSESAKAQTCVSPCYPQSAAEAAAGVTPSDTSYPPGDLRRYGAALNGTTNDRGAIEAAYAQYKAGGAHIFLPPGTCRVDQSGSSGYALKFDGNVVLNGGGAFRLLGDGTNNYTLLYVKDGANIKIDIRGVSFDCGKGTPNRASDNADICVRIESSVISLNIEDCDFSNYNEDGVYFNATVSGAGGAIHHCRFSNGARSAVTVVKGQYLSVTHNTIVGIQLQPIVVQATNSTTVCRQISVDDNRIVGGGYDTNSNTDRAAIFVAHVAGASSTYMGEYSVRNNVIKNFGTAWPGGSGLFAFGIEVREATDTLVQGNEITGCTKGSGLFSYLSTRAAFVGNISCGNDKGLWMNACSDYTEMANTCLNNLSKDRDYHGPDGATVFRQADGLTAVLARGSISYSGGTPTLNSGYNIASITDLAAGDAQLNFTKQPGSANYSVVATYRSHSGTSGMIESASHTTSSFRVLTFNGTSLSDQNFDFVVYGIPANTTEP